jgi:hypothetical protein
MSTDISNHLILLIRIATMMISLHMSNALVNRAEQNLIIILRHKKTIDFI